MLAFVRRRVVHYCGGVCWTISRQNKPLKHYACLATHAPVCTRGFTTSEGKGGASTSRNTKEAEARLKESKEEAATAKEEAAIAEKKVATAEKKVAIAEKKVAIAKEEVAIAKEEWMANKETAQAGMFLTAWETAQTAQNNAQTAQKNAHTAQKHNESALNAAQGILDGHNVWNGWNNQGSADKLPADHLDVLVATAFWNSDAEIETVNTGDNAVYAFDKDGNACVVPYDVLTFKAESPFAGPKVAKILVRDFYEQAYNEKIEPLLGKTSRQLWRGPPGIGKSRGFGMGYVLYRTRELMRSEAGCGVEQIVCTSLKDNAIVFHRDGSVDVYTHETRVRHLTTLSTTVWLMDGEAHGNYEGARSSVFLIASEKLLNYDEYYKESDGVWNIPVYDSGGQMSINDVPVELEALMHVGFPHINIDDLIANYSIHGPFPRATLSSPKLGKTRLDQDLREVKPEELFGDVQALLNGGSTLRVVFPETDRKTLLPTGRSVIASIYVLCSLERTRLKNDLATQYSLFNAVANSPMVIFDPAKMFEHKALKYFSVVDKKNQIKSRRLTARHAENINLCFGDTLELKFVDSYAGELDTSGNSGERKANVFPAFWYSMNGREVAIDGLMINSEGSIVHAFQVTWNAKHKIVGNAVAKVFCEIDPEGNKIEIFRFIWAVPARLFDKFTPKPLIAVPTKDEQDRIKIAEETLKLVTGEGGTKITAENELRCAKAAAKTGMEVRNKYLNKIEQWVVEVPREALVDKLRTAN